jgi:hypothetical protein
VASFCWVPGFLSGRYGVFLGLKKSWRVLGWDCGIAIATLKSWRDRSFILKEEAE